MSDDNRAFEELEKEKLANEVKTEVVKSAKKDLVEQAKQEFIESLQGKKERFSWEEQGREKPSSYDELFSEVEKRFPKMSQEDIDRRVEEKLREREEQQQAKEEEGRKKEAELIKQKREDFDREWYDLVQQGKMPEVAEPLREKINKGEKLTKDEIEADEGLQARIKLAELATSNNKSAKVAFYEDYDAQPAGANAPVMGQRPRATSNSGEEELDYEEVAKQRKKIFGF